MQITTLLRLFENHELNRSLPMALDSAPTDGAPREFSTRMLQRALRDAGAQNRLTVAKPDGGDLAVVSVELPGRGWFAVPVLDEPRSIGPWFALASWISLISAGAVAIALAVAHWVARPLALLEKVASTISQNGQMIVLEIGPAEVKATARALNRLTANLKVAMESRVRLVAAAGHDLRTPITRMRLRAEFLPDHEQSAWLRDLD